MTKRRGFAVNISNRIMLTPQEAALGADEGPEFLFVVYMGDSPDTKAYYFDRRGLDKLCRTFHKVDHYVKEVIDGIPTPTERIIKILKNKKAHMSSNLVADQEAVDDITAEIEKLENKVTEDVFDDSS